MLGPQYGSEIEHLAPVWKQLLGREAFRGRNPQRRLVGRPGERRYRPCLPAILLRV